MYGIQAGLAGQTSLPGDHFTYALAAGTGVDDFVVLYNYTDAPLTLSLYAADVRTAEGGALAPAQVYETMKEVGAWVRLDAAQITIPPRGEVAPRFRLNVPEGAVPGDYVGAVVAALAASRVPGGLGVETRAARLIRLKVPGEVNLGVSVSRPRSSQKDGAKEFDVVVRNTGNVLFTFTGAILIDGGRAQVKAPLDPTGIYVIPGGHTVLKARWNDAPFVGRRAARAELAVSVAGKPAGVFRSPAVQLTFLPPTVAVATGGVLASAAAFGLLTRGQWGPWRRRRRKERAVLADVRLQLRRERESISP